VQGRAHEEYATREVEQVEGPGVLQVQGAPEELDGEHQQHEAGHLLLEVVEAAHHEQAGAASSPSAALMSSTNSS